MADILSAKRKTMGGQMKYVIAAGFMIFFASESPAARLIVPAGFNVAQYDTFVVAGHDPFFSGAYSRQRISVGVISAVIVREFSRADTPAERASAGGGHQVRYTASLDGVALHGRMTVAATKTVLSNDSNVSVSLAGNQMMPDGIITALVISYEGDIYVGDTPFHLALQSDERGESLRGAVPGDLPLLIAELPRRGGSAAVSDPAGWEIRRGDTLVAVIDELNGRLHLRKDTDVKTREMVYAVAFGLLMYRYIPL